jgi:hypothetical protein
MVRLKEGKEGSLGSWLDVVLRLGASCAGHVAAGERCMFISTSLASQMGRTRVAIEARRPQIMAMITHMVKYVETCPKSDTRWLSLSCLCVRAPSDDDGPVDGMENDLYHHSASLK